MPLHAVPENCVVAALAASALPVAAQNSDLAASAERQLPALTETYKHLHRNPELSRHEEQTSAFVAGELRKLGYTVTEHVGKYEDGAQAFGVVAVLENGPGPRLLIRTDMDALPVEEKTGLDYASTVKTTNAQGQQVGVMHACGHDLHMTVLLGAAREMAARKSQWHGTLMLIGQPAEEVDPGRGGDARRPSVRALRPARLCARRARLRTTCRRARSPSRAGRCWPAPPRST